MWMQPLFPSPLPTILKQTTILINWLTTSSFRLRKIELHCHGLSACQMQWWRPLVVAINNDPHMCMQFITRFTCKIKSIQKQINFCCTFWYLSYTETICKLCRNLHSKSERWYGKHCINSTYIIFPFKLYHLQIQHIIF